MKANSRHCKNCTHNETGECQHPSRRYIKGQATIPRHPEKDKRICGWHEYSDSIRRRWVPLEKVF